MYKTAWMLAGVLSALPMIATSILVPNLACAAEGDGLRPGAGQVPWAKWQGRLSLVTSTDPWRLGVESASHLSSASLMGDYYFGRVLTGPNGSGGLRATSGLIFGPRSVLGIAQVAASNGSIFSIGRRESSRVSPLPYGVDATVDGPATTTPYLGIGYTGLSPRSGWGFNADLGLVAKSASTQRLSSGPGLDDLVRDLHTTPLLQLGVSYSF